jgi:hypothetical protein
LEKLLVERVAHIHAGGDEFVQDWLDLGNDPAIFCFLEHTQASNHCDALADGFTSCLALIDEEDGVLLFGQRNGLAFSQVEFLGKLINERAVTPRDPSNP